MATFGCSIADKSKAPAGISFKYRASSAGRKVVTAAEITLQSNDWCLDEENVEALVKAYEESSAMPNGFLKHLNELGSSNQAPFAKSFGFAATYFGFTKGLIENVFDDEMVKELKKCWKVMLQFGFGGLYQSFFSPVVVNKLHNNPEEKITVVGEPQIWTPKEHKPQPFTDEEKKKYGADVVNNARFLLNSVELLAAEGAGDAIRQTAFDVAKSQTLLMDLVLKKNKKSFDDCKAQFDLKSHRELHKMVHRFFDGDNLKHGELFKKQIVNRYKLYHFFNVSVRDELKKCLDKVVAVAEANKENVGQTVGAVSAGAATAVAETAGSAKSDIAEPAANKSDPAAGKEGALVISDEDETPKTDDGNKELQNKAVSTKVERRKKDNPAYITFDSSSDEDEDVEVKSSASSEYKPDSRESVDFDYDDKINSDSESTKPSKASIIINDSDEEIIAKKTKNNKRRRVVLDNDQDSDVPDDDTEEEINRSQKIRTRRIKTRNELEKETVNVEEAEKERKKRLLERQKEFNGIEYETVATEDGISLVKVLNNLILDNDSTAKKNNASNKKKGVESVPSPISSNSDNICNDIAELKNVATSSSVVKFGEKETQTCQSNVDQTTQTEHIIFEEYYQNNDNESNEEEMEIDDSGYSDIQTCQIITKPSVSKPILRKSIRIKEKNVAKNATNKKKGKTVAETLKHYFDCAAEIPNFQDETEAAIDSDRDERVSTPEDFLKCKIGDKIVPNSSNLLTDEILKKCKIHQYFSACGTKFNGDTDSALIHLSANGYSIKKALESIDNPDSIPMKRIHENLGIWRKKEMNAFVKNMSKKYKRNKECKICGLCKLYFELYGKQRPNAKALPLHFNLSPKRI